MSEGLWGFVPVGEEVLGGVYYDDGWFPRGFQRLEVGCILHYYNGLEEGSEAVALVGAEFYDCEVFVELAGCGALGFEGVAGFSLEEVL